jgi:hypothetical protein
MTESRFYLPKPARAVEFRQRFRIANVVRAEACGEERKKYAEILMTQRPI